MVLIASLSRDSFLGAFSSGVLAPPAPPPPMPKKQKSCEALDANAMAQAKQPQQKNQHLTQAQVR